MNQTTCFAVLASLLLPALAGCDMTAEPIGGGGSSSSSSTAASTGAGPGTGTGGGGSGQSGACAPACGAGEVCVADACHAVVKLDTADTVTAGGCNIVVDATNVYWQSSEVRRVPKAGGAAAILDSGTSSPGGLVVDDTYLYWTDLGVVRAAKNAPPVPGTTAGAPFADEGGSPTHMGGDGTTLYYLDTAAIDEVATAGTPAPNATPVVFSPTWSSVGAPIAVNATSVFFWSEAASVLTRIDKATPALMTTVATRGNGVVDDTCNIVLDGSTVFYSTAPQPATGGIVASVPSVGGQGTMIVDGSNGASGPFAVDADSVYFMTPTAVMRVGKGGGTPVSVRALSPPSPFPTCIAVDETYVYWVDGLDLMRYTK